MTSRRSKRRSRRGLSPRPGRPDHGHSQHGDAAQSRFGLVLAATAFLSAFLLFQVQPLIGKAILPWFGGSPAVWTTGLFFFQATLLAGYGYAHLTIKYLPPKLQGALHVGLLAAAVALLPIYPSTELKLAGGDLKPTWRVVSVLLRTVGIQFFILSTTAPLTQVWWHRISQRTPYRLYAVSNAGSLLALVSYPFLVEPNLGVRGQAVVWSVGFGVFAILVSWSGVLAWRAGTAPERLDAAAERSLPTWRRVATWLGLSACGSVLLLAMTNHVSQNVAVVPLLWVGPLALYLLSFILTFADSRCYHRGVFGGLMVATLAGCSYLYDFDVVYDVMFLLAIHWAGLFAACMVCHGELARLKPDAGQLTAYYLTISAGGAVGGFLVSLAAPVIFPRYYEYPLALIACWLVLMAIALRDKSWWLYRGRPIWAWGLILLIFAYFLMHLRDGVIKDAIAAYLTRRNFYGVLSVQHAPSDVPPTMWAELRHGIIRHGAQYLDENKRFEPTSYYATSSGLGYAMRSVAGKQDKRVGMLGLGIGTIAAYCEPGDYFRVYEIDPDVIQIATNPQLFTFCTLFVARRATLEIIEGDARTSLERELDGGRRNNFDVLVLDVFTGDAIPVHLLTREAFATYFQHLAADGILAVHVSNRHLNLVPVVQALAADCGMGIADVEDGDVSHWVLLARPPVLNTIAQQSGGNVRLLRETSYSVMWTDDYSNIFSVLK